MASTSPTTKSRSEHEQTLDRSNDSQNTDSGRLTEPATVCRSASGLKARKRTKTGCLTCRKRRIKCGEERPTCKNCTKSRRDCEGYIPKVIFKDQVFGSRASVGISPINNPYIQHGVDPNGAASMFGNTATASADGLPLAPLAPRPPLYGRQAGYLPTSEAAVHPGSRDSYADPGYAYDNQSYPTSAARSGAQQVQQMSNAYATTQNDSDRRGFAAPNNETSAYLSLQHHETGESDSGIDMGQADGWSHSSASGTAHPTQFRHPYLSSPVRSPTNQAPDDMSPSLKFEPSYAQFTHQMHGQPLQSPFSPSQFEDCYPGRQEAILQGHVDQQAHSQYEAYGIPSAPVNWEGETADDWFDEDSDEENADMEHHLGKIPPSDLGMMIHMSANQNNMNVRSMTNFLNEPNVLATYHPSYAASPLADPQTARVFCHFITATAPTLNVCERHPSNPAVIFSGRPVPRSQRALWSYTMPMLALHHQGLLHAMLALASLHIAKLQHGTPTPSLKHYHYALRRVAKCLGNQKKRRDVGTLAATLLLGFYEVTTAEHNKWNSHLSGARELISDIDFAKMARRIDAHRTRREEAEANQRPMQTWYMNGYEQTYPRRPSDDSPARSDRKLDENLIGTIMGWKTRYNEYGQIIDDSEPSFAPDERLTPGDVENFEIQCDLFWWYAKQDMFQSIISGNRLLLSYDRWGHCPPRAPIGRLDAVYGTMDHLLLLMARLADFASKDSPRKRRAAMEAEKRSKGQGRFQPQAPPPVGNGPSSQNGQLPPVPMYGMIPDPGPVRLPPGFDQAQHDRIYGVPTPSEDKSLSAATADAETEWLAIQHGFDTYHAALGPSYAPLSAEHMTPTATPFGPALYYRSYPVACVLSLYYCGRIILTRAHPSMPPAAMAAAGVAAPQTAPHATMIGRICAGIQPVSNTAPLNPHHGAALMDICMGLFHAGVQYRDPAQRGWTITKLRDIARLTGWQTSALIASGCERAWIRAAEMGRGPPYERTMNKTAKDDRVAGRSRDPSVLAEPPKDNNDRRFVHRNAGTRVYWAMGILSVEEDMLGDAVEGLNLDG